MQFWEGFWNVQHFTGTGNYWTGVCHPVVKVQVEVHSKVHNIEMDNNKPQHKEIRINILYI